MGSQLILTTILSCQAHPYYPPDASVELQHDLIISDHPITLWRPLLDAAASPPQIHILSAEILIVAAAEQRLGELSKYERVG